MRRWTVWFIALLSSKVSAAESPEARHDRLYDLLLRRAAYGEDVVPALTTFAQQLPSHDVSYHETLYWLARSEYEHAHADEARRWLRDAIRRAGPMRERSLTLLFEMELDQSGVQSLPVRWSFDTPAHGLVHPETAEGGGTVRIDTTADPLNPSLWWSPRDTSGKDRLTIGFRNTRLIPRVVSFKARAVGADAHISAEFSDLLGRTYTVKTENAAIVASRWTTVEWSLDEPTAADGVRRLDPHLIERLEIHAAPLRGNDVDVRSGPFSIKIDEFEIK